MKKMMKIGEKWRKMKKNRKPEAAKARSDSRGPPAETETGNRKPEAAKARSGSRGPPAETGNRSTGNHKPEAAKARSGSTASRNRKPEKAEMWKNGEK